MQSEWTGKNTVHCSNVLLFDSAGRLVVSVQITRFDPDGTLFCPPGALSFHETMVLIGAWQDGGRLCWEERLRRSGQC